MYLERYKRAGAAAGWHFLTGDRSSIDRLTRAAGFRYAWDADTKQFAHPSGVIVLTPEGRLARYLFGIEYSPRDLRFALVEASSGRVGSRVDALLLYCYHYDPMTGRYGFVIMRAIRLAGAATVLALAAFIIVMIRRERAAPAYQPGSCRSCTARSCRRRGDRRASPPRRSSIEITMWSGTPLFPESASTMASRVDALYFFLIGITVFFSLLIAGLIVYYAVRFRRRHPDAVGARIHGGLVLEITWSVIPLLITMVIFVWGATVFFAMTRPPEDALNIYVVGKQWMWKFQHLDGQREINELHVPLGRPVKLIMTSEDVIHDLFVPAFRMKADVIPGRYTNIWFQPTKPGRYHLFCAEYCGTRHSGMIGEVVVMGPTEYQTWLSGGAPEGSLASTGAKLFQDLACNTCHRPDAQGRGPVLEGLFGRTLQLQTGETVTADEAYVRESILMPAARVAAGFQPIMPAFQGLVTEEQLLALIEYVKSLQTLPQVQTR